MPFLGRRLCCWGGASFARSKAPGTARIRKGGAGMNVLTRNGRAFELSRVVKGGALGSRKPRAALAGRGWGRGARGSLPLPLGGPARAPGHPCPPLTSGPPAPQTAHFDYFHGAARGRGEPREGRAGKRAAAFSRRRRGAARRGADAAAARVEGAWLPLPLLASMAAAAGRSPSPRPARLPRGQRTRPAPPLSPPRELPAAPRLPFPSQTKSTSKTGASASPQSSCERCRGPRPSVVGRPCMCLRCPAVGEGGARLPRAARPVPSTKAAASRTSQPPAACL